MKIEGDILTTIQLSWKEDSKMDIDHLDIEAMRIPILHSKYIDEYSKIKQLKTKKESDKKILQ
jgi:hypothetical protein